MRTHCLHVQCPTRGTSSLFRILFYRLPHLQVHRPPDSRPNTLFMFIVLFSFCLSQLLSSLFGRAILPYFNSKRFNDQRGSNWVDFDVYSSNAPRILSREGGIHCSRAFKTRRRFSADLGRKRVLSSGNNYKRRYSPQFFAKKFLQKKKMSQFCYPLNWGTQKSRLFAKR